MPFMNVCFGSQAVIRERLLSARSGHLLLQSFVQASVGEPTITAPYTAPTLAYPFTLRPQRIRYQPSPEHSLQGWVPTLPIALHK